MFDPGSMALATAMPSEGTRRLELMPSRKTEVVTKIAINDPVHPRHRMLWPGVVVTVWPRKGERQLAVA
jgi:hypothetical protein